MKYFYLRAISLVIFGGIVSAYLSDDPWALAMIAFVSIIFYIIGQDYKEQKGK